MALDFTATELRLASAIGRQIGNKWGRVPTEEVVSDLNLWLCENHKYVRRWRDAGALGRNKLELSLRRRASKFCRKEFDVMKPSLPDWDYTPATVTPILSALFQYPDWSDIVADSGSDVWASLADVSAAFATLNPTDQALLRWRLGSGLRFAEIAEELDLASPDAARMRVNRALARVAERASVGSVRWVARQNFGNKGRALYAGRESAPLHARKATAE